MIVFQQDPFPWVLWRERGKISVWEKAFSGFSLPRGVCCVRVTHSSNTKSQLSYLGWECVGDVGNALLVCVRTNAPGNESGLCCCCSRERALFVKLHTNFSFPLFCLSPSEDSSAVFLSSQRKASENPQISNYGKLADRLFDCPFLSFLLLLSENSIFSAPGWWCGTKLETRNKHYNFEIVSVFVQSICKFPFFRDERIPCDDLQSCGR